MSGSGSPNFVYTWSMKSERPHQLTKKIVSLPGVDAGWRVVDQPLLHRRRVDEVVLADVARPALLVVEILELGAIRRGRQTLSAAKNLFSHDAFANVTSTS